MATAMMMMIPCTPPLLLLLLLLLLLDDAVFVCVVVVLGQYLALLPAERLLGERADALGAEDDPPGRRAHDVAVGADGRRDDGLQGDWVHEVRDGVLRVDLGRRLVVAGIL